MADRETIARQRGMRRQICRSKRRSPDFPPNETPWSEHGDDWLTKGPMATDSWKLAEHVRSVISVLCAAANRIFGVCEQRLGTSKPRAMVVCELFTLQAAIGQVGLLRRLIAHLVQEFCEWRGRRKGPTRRAE